MIYGVIFGANSYEHEISIVSAIVLKKVLKEKLEFIYCDENKEFFLIDENKMNAKTFSSKEYKNQKQIYIKNNGFYTKSFFKDKKLEIDVYINLVHGKDGEDGKIASLLDFFDIKYIGPRIEASVLSYNKELTKLYANKVGVKTLPYTMLRSYDENNIMPELPCILKPARLGSSIGIEIVKNLQELEYAKDIGFEFDDDILVENFKSNIKEYNLAGCMVNDEFIFSIIEEPKKDDFLDFEQKYLSFSSNEEIKSANISKELEDKLKENFKKIYNPCFKGALIRCDFFVIDNEVYLNEINPNPGSLANYLFNDFTNVINKLASSLKSEKHININYSFLHSINGQKGKL